MKPVIIKGGMFSDERGSISFVNDFNFPRVKRFYIIKNRDPQLFRAWQGHKTEAKYFYPLKGEISIYLVKVDDWGHPSRDLVPEQFIINAHEPAILSVPPGYANGIKMNTLDAELLVFSVSDIENAENIKYPQEYWLIK